MTTTKAYCHFPISKVSQTKQNKTKQKIKIPFTNAILIDVVVFFVDVGEADGVDSK